MKNMEIHESALGEQEERGWCLPWTSHIPRALESSPLVGIRICYLPRCIWKLPDYVYYRKHGESTGNSSVPVLEGPFTRLASVLSLRAKLFSSSTAELEQLMDLCTGRRNIMDNVESMQISYETLKTITDDFSEERFLGSGTFGVVYKGALASGKEIAVKVLRDMAALDDKNFRNEFHNLVRLKHQNIVQLVGYCNESEKQILEHDDGTKVTAEKMHMALCFEYVENGSLQKHISDGTHGLQWHVYYRIIRGICEGLKHLREGLDKPVWHLDLKPDNILLDKEMMPKIADFGLSRLIGDERTRKTMDSVGTCGYWPPEYVRFQLLSSAFDIFSLGVIITKIMIGTRGYHDFADMPPRKLIKHVCNNWKKKLCEMVKPGSLDLYCHQVKTCIEIASKCLKEDRHERPSIQDIIVTLNETETMRPNTKLQFNGGYIIPSNSSSTFMSSSGYRKNRLNCPYVIVKYSYELLRKITNNFSEDGLLGEGGFGRVYKGVFEDGQEISVEVLRYSSSFGPKHFQNEIEKLAKFQHQNIIQLLGYCYEVEEVAAEFNGRVVIAAEIHAVICFKYFPNGSLEQHISDEYHRLSWCTCYKIIKGTCEGLRYLHEGLPSPILHFGLNLSNILLDENMVPKIGDYVLSGLMGEEETKRTISSLGRIEHLPPEFITKQVISKELDIFSLGIIMLKVVAGMSLHSLSRITTPQEFMELVLGRWRKRLEATFFLDRRLDATLKGWSVEGYCKQVKKCTEIAFKCLQADRHRRPKIGDIVRVLDETEIWNHDENDPELLGVHPKELCFLFRPKKYASCLLQLHNKEDDHVAFKLLSKSLTSKYFKNLPHLGVVPPRCTYTLSLTTSNQLKHLPPSDSNEGLVLQSIAVSHRQELPLQYLDKATVVREYESVFKNVKESDDHEVQVQEVTVKCISARLAEEASSTLSRQEIEITTMPDARRVSSVEVHPTKPWIMTTHEGGNLRIWNYHTMALLNPIKIPDESVHVAKFIAREEWIVAGDSNGCIHVFSYDEIQDDMSFEAHNGQIISMAVHPTDSYVLSSSHGDHIIKLWHWDEYWDFDKGIWMCTRTFDGHSDKVSRVTFNPEETGSFATASWDGTVKIWSINSDVYNTVTLGKHSDGLLCVDYVNGAERQHLITGSKDGSAQIWDLNTKTCMEYLQGHETHVSVVYGHPEHQKLITGSLDGTVRIWDSTTFRLENIIAFNLGAVSDLGYIEELQRIVVGCHHGIAMMEIKFP